MSVSGYGRILVSVLSLLALTIVLIPIWFATMAWCQPPSTASETPALANVGTATGTPVANAGGTSTPNISANGLCSPSQVMATTTPIPTATLSTSLEMFTLDAAKVVWESALPNAGDTVRVIVVVQYKDKDTLLVSDTAAEFTAQLLEVLDKDGNLLAVPFKVKDAAKVRLTLDRQGTDNMAFAKMITGATTIYILRK